MILMPLLISPVGIGICCLGYGPLSTKNNPTASVAFQIVGLVFRLVGALLIVLGAFFWIFALSMAFGGR